VEVAHPVLEKEIDPAIIGKIIKASEFSLGIFERSIVSFFNNDMKKSHQNIESLRALENLCEEINNLILQQEMPDSIALGYITESVRRGGIFGGYLGKCDQLPCGGGAGAKKGKTRPLMIS